MGEATSALRVKASFVRSAGGKNWSISKTPSLRIGGAWISRDQRAEVEVASGAPGVLDQVGEQHVLAARERVGVDPDELQEARHRALDLVAKRLLLGLPGELRRRERADTLSGTPAVEPGV